jgi:eukaryotic-like serine/threonine-protein kinase
VSDAAASIRAGVRVGQYEILSALGRGGMGEVWRARDTTLDREVAIKALPDALADDPDRLARLEREAKVLASLNHPHIAAIYGLGQSGGTPFLVLELVEGLTLADQLVQGALSVEDALKVTLQVAESLEAAHEKGIVHRDLKPANIKVTPEGRVKVLDFGLAKAVATATDEVATQAAATQTGVVMGTPAYMSPEQARAAAVGPQTDVWSLGVVLYELLTGRSAFGQATTADTLARVLGAQPDYTLLPAETPPAVRALIRRCVEKSQRRRLQHMGDIRIQIEDALAALTTGDVPISGGQPVVRGWKLKTVGMIAAATAVAAGLVGWIAGQRSAPESLPGPARVVIPFAEPPFRQPYGMRNVAISDDGSRIAYASSSRLWTRRMDEGDATALGATGSNPFFSPDGQWIGLFRDAGLIKVPVNGGTPVMIAATSDRPAGATWRADGTIVFATSEGLFQVSAEGGAVKTLAKPDRQRKEQLYAWPQFLPDGQSLLFTVVPQEGSAGAQVALLDLRTLQTTKVLTGGSDARYVSTGHLVYASGSTLRAVAFDLGTRQMRGDSFQLPAVESATAANGAAQFAVSQSGTLVHLPGVPITSGDLAPRARTLSWIDRNGVEEPLALKPSSYNYPRVSPDGTRVAVEISTGGNRDIWILNLERLTMTQLTDGPTEDLLAVWSPDGQRVFFASDRGGNFDIYSQAADGATPARLEFASPAFHTPQSITPDGKRLIVYEAFRDTGVVTLGQPDRLERLLFDESDDRSAQLSPDGSWIAHESNESGAQFEIFVRSFPNVNERREQVSSGGGRYPIWNPKGHELFYVNTDGEMMAVPMTVSPRLSLGRATKLFQWIKPPAERSGLPHGISPLDGRFLMVKPFADGQGQPTLLSVILNVDTMLERR